MIQHTNLLTTEPGYTPAPGQVSFDNGAIVQRFVRRRPAGAGAMVSCRANQTRVRERLGEETALGDGVEIGCGTGFFTEALARRAGSLVATDLAPGMIDLAQRRLAGVGNVRFHTEDCERTSFADGAFDTAFMSLVLHFVDAPTALGEMNRILKPGGTLIIANLDVLALPVPLRLVLVARTMVRSAITYRRALPRVNRDRLLSEVVLRQRLEAAGFRVTYCQMIRDTSAPWNCPVDYVKAVKEQSSGEAGPANA